MSSGFRANYPRSTAPIAYINEADNTGALLATGAQTTLAFDCGAVATVTWETTSTDAASFSYAAGAFTAQKSATILIVVTSTFESEAQNCNIAIRKNGTTLVQEVKSVPVTVPQIIGTISVSTVTTVVAGDTIDVRAYSSGAVHTVTALYPGTGSRVQIIQQ